MNRHRFLAAFFCIAMVAACDKNAVQQLPLEPLAAAEIKYFNYGLNAPGVNFYADNAKVGTATDTLGVRYSFGAASGAYTAIAPGQYTLSARVAAGTNKDTTIASVTATVADGKSYSLYLSGLYMNDSTAYVRFVNAIYNAQPLNLYAANAFTNDTLSLGGAVAYQATAAFTAIPTGIYNLFARYTDSTTNKVTRTAQSFLGGHIYTVGARGDITVTSATATNRPFLDNTGNR
ncbi:MAG: hypothetical protein DMG78_31400 [Acidobacteria bacterium]|nr:MAG: hypothetical protein DMG78_31400 [Acidobacteriota bacterium]